MNKGFALFFCVHDIETALLIVQQTGITHLTAGLRIERCIFKNHHRFITGSDRIDCFASFIQRNHFGLIQQVFVTGEIGDRIGADRLVVIEAELAGGARLFTLPLHRRFIARHIQRQPMFAGDIRG